MLGCLYDYSWKRWFRLQRAASSYLGQGQRRHLNTEFYQRAFFLEAQSAPDVHFLTPCTYFHFFPCTMIHMLRKEGPFLLCTRLVSFLCWPTQATWLRSCGTTPCSPSPFWFSAGPRMHVLHGTV